MNDLTDADRQNILINTKVPNIILRDINGTMVDAGKLEYRYLLIDFWASWCIPCRKQTPYLLKTYNAYKEKGFKILSLSIDSNSTKWKEAVITDGTAEFIHVYDPAASKSTYLKQFKVNYIPVNFLVDRNGVIVAKNLSGDDLYNEVAKVMDSK